MKTNRILSTEPNNLNFCYLHIVFVFSEEEINNMKIELEKYNIQMPTFSKIGGILANELSVDEAACEHCLSLCFLSRIPLGFLAQLLPL